MTISITSAHTALLDQLFLSFFERKKAPGMVYAVTKDGALLHTRAFGHQTLAPLTPAEISTRFRIASMTKSFACAALLKLRDQGKISLVTPLSAILPGIPLAQPLHSATLHQLISMSLDLPVDDPWADRQLGASDDELTKFFSKPLLCAEAGAGRYSYSNLSYFLLGRVITQVSGRSALSFIEEEIVRPLSLSSTCWNPPSPEASGCAIGHRFDSHAWRPEPFVPCIGDGAVFAGIWSSLKDLAVWLDFLRADARPNNQYEAVLASSSRREMQGAYAWMAPHTFTRSSDGSAAVEHASYGYGLVHSVIDGMHYVGHSGGIPGYGSHMRVNLETGLGIAACGNGTYCPTEEVCREALDLVVREKFLCGKQMDTVVNRLGSKLAAHLLADSDSTDTDLFIETMHLDYPPEEFKRDCTNHLGMLGTRASIIISEISPLPRSLGRVVFSGNGNEAVVEFGICPFGPPERIQSVEWKKR